ncbi:MAG: inositol monophosphatase family protein [Candidatus Hodarchaeota archaeon]
MNNLFLDVAIKAAKIAGEALLDTYGKTKKNFKSDQSIVTEADLKADSLIKNIIEKQFPTHSILSEESGKTIKKSDYLWAIDPLDGTTNFSVQNPYFAVSIALLNKQQPLIGVVYSPFQDELFAAKRHEGAYLNTNLINVDRNSTLEESFIAFCNGRDRSTRELIIKIYSKLKLKNNFFRQVGVPSLDLCYVASGRFGAFLMPGINSWDIAAGALIVQEAKGTVTDFHNNEFSIDSNNVLASSSSLHAQLLRIITQVL